MNEIAAATCIQKNWRAFVSDRRHAYREALEIASRIAYRLERPLELDRYWRPGRILLQFRGEVDDPVNSHGTFIVDGANWHLVRGPKDKLWPLVGSDFSRRPIPVASNVPQYACITCNGKELAPSHQALRQQIQDGTAITFVLSRGLTKIFHMAFQAERQKFPTRWISFGLHYNGITFVRNVLMRMERLDILEHVHARRV